jgi:magnesium transporter
MKSTLAKIDWDDDVTDHMHRDLPQLREALTVGEALAWLRQNPPPGRIIYFYVVDDKGHLRGVVPTRRLVLSSPDELLVNIMVREVVAVPAQATVLDACEFFIQHRFLAFPIVDEENHLLGMVDVELYTEELSQLGDRRVSDDLFQLIGVHATAAREGPSSTASFRHRFPWLGCNLVAGILAAFLAGVYQDELNRVVALAFFIPVVLNLAESVSSQSVSLALHLLHGQAPRWKELPASLGRELGTGLMLGLASGAVVGLVAYVWLGHIRVALCLIGGICGGVAVAAVLGLSLPFLLRLLRLEPRVAAGPVALAGADVVTILLYLNLARWLLT